MDMISRAEVCLDGGDDEEHKRCDRWNIHARNYRYLLSSHGQGGILKKRKKNSKTKTMSKNWMIRCEAIQQILIRKECQKPCMLLDV